MNRYIKNAQKILIGNRKRGYTLPTNNKLYPAQWNWDSAFIALGYSYFNLNFALKEIKTLLDGQWKDGMIPHILFHNTDTNYYPNHTAWNCGNKIHSSGITQPPVLASILKQIIDKNKITKSYIKKIKGLSKIARNRDQTLSQLAIAWILRHKTMTSALIGSRTVKQLNDCLDSLNNLKFTKSELKQIDKFAKEEKINLWEPSSRY